MSERLPCVLRAAIGDDGTGAMWNRLTPDGREVIRLAFGEARELGHPCLADEHVLLGVLRHGTSQAAALLQARSLDLATARADLLRVGPNSWTERRSGWRAANPRHRGRAASGAP